MFENIKSEEEFLDICGALEVEPKGINLPIKPGTHDYEIRNKLFDKLIKMFPGRKYCFESHQPITALIVRRIE